MEEDKPQAVVLENLTVGQSGRQARIRYLL
jgi:hypothetical protein